MLGLGLLHEANADDLVDLDRPIATRSVVRSGQPAMAEAATGAVRVERVRGRSALTRCFARYPLKLIAPSKVGPSSCDAVWLYALTYGGGIVSVSPRTSLHFLFSPFLPAAPLLGTRGSEMVAVA